MKPQLQAIYSCVECPFADDLDHVENTTVWHCHGVYTPEGWPRPMPVAPSTPPKWCPLRKRPRLIVLQ